MGQRIGAPLEFTPAHDAVVGNNGWCIRLLMGEKLETLVDAQHRPHAVGCLGWEQ